MTSFASTTSSEFSFPEEYIPTNASIGNIYRRYTILWFAIALYDTVSLSNHSRLILIHLIRSLWTARYNPLGVSSYMERRSIFDDVPVLDEVSLSFDFFNIPKKGHRLSSNQLQSLGIVTLTSILDAHGFLIRQCRWVLTDSIVFRKGELISVSIHSQNFVVVSTGSTA